MAKVKKTATGYKFMCPGCKELHQPSDAWKFNGDFERPTFEPSVLVTSGHYLHGDKSSCWCTFNEERIAEGVPQSGFQCQICHSFVRNGKIEFLSDSTHDLAGQTVDLPELAS